MASSLRSSSVRVGRDRLSQGVFEMTEVPDDPHGVVVANLYDAISR